MNYYTPVNPLASYEIVFLNDGDAILQRHDGAFAFLFSDMQRLAAAVFGIESGEDPAVWDGNQPDIFVTDEVYDSAVTGQMFSLQLHPNERKHWPDDLFFCWGNVAEFISELQALEDGDRVVLRNGKLAHAWEAYELEDGSFIHYEKEAIELADGSIVPVGDSMEIGDTNEFVLKSSVLLRTNRNGETYYSTVGGNGKVYYSFSPAFEDYWTQDDQDELERRQNNGN
jgi:hypothetical protein